MAYTTYVSYMPLILLIIGICSTLLYGFRNCASLITIDSVLGAGGIIIGMCWFSGTYRSMDIDSLFGISVIGMMLWILIAIGGYKVRCFFKKPAESK